MPLRFSWDRSDIAEYLVYAAAWAYVIVFAVISVLRLRYPFDLEWMEGAMVDHVYRVVSGQKIYVPPSIDFIPYLYPPLYYYVCAAMSLVTGIGLLPLRLVSLLSAAACLSLIFRLAQRETASRYVGVVAMGMFAAAYAIGGAWLDLARVDSLALALMLGSFYAARFAESTRAWAAAGVLLALSALTKQTALLAALPLVVYAGLVSWRFALVLAVTGGGLFAVVTLGLDAWHEGWYLYYTVGLPAGIKQVGTISVDFWSKDIVAAMPAASVFAVGFLASRRMRTRAALFYLAITIGLVGSSWLSRLHSGASVNVLLPAYACLALLFALAMHDLPTNASGDEQRTVRTFVAVVCLVQFGLLAYDARAEVPTAGDIEAGKRLIQVMRNAPGEVYMASHGYIPHLAGKRTYAHSWAIADILRAGADEDKRRVRDQLRQAIEQRHFRLIILDRPQDPWLHPYLEENYRRVGSAVRGNGLWTRTGYRTRPRVILEPKERAP